MEKEEYVQKLSFLQEEIGKLEEQINLINQQLNELETLNFGLEKFKKFKEEKEVLASLGKGIFFSAEIKDNHLLVNVGSGIILKKSPEETAEIIKKQALKLEEMRKSLVSEIEKINEVMRDLIKRYETE